MARPIKDGCSYFPHDCDLSHDEKIESLEAIHGNDGYATYLKLLERIYRNGVSVSVIDAETRQILARKCNVTIEKFTTMIEMMVRIGLFGQESYEKGFLTSNGVQKRLDAINSKRRRERNSCQVSNTDNPAITQQERLKVKESKVNKTKAVGKPPQDDQQFLLSLKTNPAYAHINVEIELLKAKAWIDSNPGRKMSRKFIVNWLNRVEAPIHINKPEPKKQF